jgi:hypothetical protein
MDEATLPTDPTHSILGNFALGCYSVVLGTPTQEWTSIDGNLQ